MNPSAVSCSLCGLTLKYGTIKWISDDREFSFCCIGCRQVFSMLLQAADALDPSQFKHTDLFIQCRQMGIIPGSESDLATGRGTDHVPFNLSAGPMHSASALAPPHMPAENILSLQLKIYDMWCPACAWVIEQVLGRQPGVARVSCNFSTDRVRCEYNPVQTSPQQLMGAIGSLGYRAALPEEDIQTAAQSKDFIRFGVSAFLTANVMMLSVSLYSGFFIQLTPDTIHKLSWPTFFMASIVLFYGGPQIYRKAWAGFISAAFGMETLITIGALTAYVYSTFNLLSGSIHLYYDTACMLITLTLLGKAIERKAKDAVQKDLGIFFSLRPTKVKRVSDVFPGGRYVAAELLGQGDVFKIEPGEIIAADGLILEGSGSVDESSLTGEALPVFKKIGHRVRSGTRVLQGVLTVRAEAVGAASTLGQMIRIMEKALGQKLPLEGKTDRILRGFVPLVLMLALLTGWVCLFSGFSFETAVIRAVTVMVISCPCALGIAIPIARVAGISAAGNKGILVRDFAAFEQAQRTDTIVFDKTGTLTRGEWSLQDIIVAKPFSDEQVLTLAAGLEKTSDHYIAAEIVRQARQRNLTPPALKNIQISENGISGILETAEIKIGSKTFVGGNFAAAFPGIEHETLQSTVYMSYGNQPCAAFLFGDTLRRTAAETVEKLRNMGYTIALVSGDGEETTRAIGKMLGIENALGAKLPQAKAAFIRDLQIKGKIVAMVGDGINDAPALVQADLAVAVHSGSHLGKEAADITLMQGNPGQIPDYLYLAKQVNRKIKQNLLFSLFYNVVSIPIAMSGLLTPLVAVSAMLLSSLSVTGNTLLLKHEHGPD